MCSINAPPVAAVLSLITFVAAIHAHLASIWTHVALHALHSCLAGTQTRHLLAVVPDGACGIAVTRCHGEVEETREKKVNEKKKVSIRENERMTDMNNLVYKAHKLCLRQP